MSGREGRVTGSLVRDVMFGTPKAKLKAANTMRLGRPMYGKTPIKSLAWGIDNEPWLRSEFWERHPELDGHWSDKSFCAPDEDGIDLGDYQDLEDFIGVSPDGLIHLPEQPTGWEGKCPYNKDVQRDVVDSGVVPAKYYPQVQLSILVTGSDWWWFSSGDPRADGRYRYFELKVPRDDKFIDQMVEAIRDFRKVYKKGGDFSKGSVKRVSAKSL